MNGLIGRRRLRGAARVLLAVLCVAMAAVSCAEVWGNPEPAPEIQKRLLLESGVSWNGDTVPNRIVGVPQCSVLHITIPPHSRLADHSHDLLNCAYVLKGQLHVVDDQGRDITINEGDALLECVGRNHYGENLTDEEVVLVVFYVGNPGEPLSVAAK